MPIVRDLIQTVVISKTPGHQSASLQVHGDIANITALQSGRVIMQGAAEAIMTPEALHRIYGERPANAFSGVERWLL
ncbi:hypothetical protein [Rhizobium rosettiformans]|uniref:hypothetical protein n=1 Tax=Rhizobium rosettiformans TaxID=1368430 RepID=UPI00286028A3|nr:hypothetical protein [Rhizobium rosettiformans]MDR7030630.1 ABC-type enterochelin transport system ATPase subunit [Rhizobium rosettiformans]MDR7066505.1 ABC-type enterochelin transport system ATPase subunit [Rhizobium rosettiformans]